MQSDFNFGASGFLGAAAANKLAESEQVVAVVRPSSNIFRINKNEAITILRFQEEEWASLVFSLKPRVVICAQWQGIEKHQRNIEEIQIRNVQEIIDIAEAVRKLKCQKFISFGSQAESGESSDRISEDLLNNAVNSYGKSKSILGKALFSLFANSDTQLTWVRIFSVYGPTEKRDSVIRKMGLSLIHGNEFEIEQPRKKWSFLYIDDFAQGIECIVGREGGPEVINLANPDLIEIRNIPALIGLEKYSISQRFHDPCIGYFPRVDKLQQLGWKNSISVEVGCKLTIESLLLE